ncbi:MAG: polyprenyl synthetase family protein [Candidatus Diapherotrites archaeon]|nr:polyprenyl synthetase family protein [Candidatus Diapherotrites archaeon]
MPGEQAVQILQNYKAKLDLELYSYLDTKIKSANPFGKFSTDLVENLKEFNTRGGKRSRGTFAIFGFKCLQKGFEKEIVKAAISLELVQAYLLVHDDIMDEADMRRGKPSFHKEYEEICVKEFPEFNRKRFGESVALLGGDLLASFGYDALIQSSFSDNLKFKALNKLNEIIYDTCFGQVLDMLGGAKKELTEDEILQIQTLKTARYSVEGPLILGAILGGAKPNDLKILSNYGIPVGQAFQIQDDILGMFGNEEKIGKPADSDLKEGKKTLLILKALEKGSEDQKKIIRYALGNKDLNKNDADRVRQAIKDTGSYDYSVQLAKKLIAKGKFALKKGKFNSEGKEFLLGIADYMLSREY